MAKTKKKVSKIKTKKKIWFKVFAPKLFGQKEIGESYLSSADVAVGRTLKINLKELTGNVRDQNVHFGFRISGVDGSSLRTEIISYQLSTAYIKRTVRKDTNRIDNHFKLKTKDGKNVILKSLVVTRNKSQRSVRTALAKKLEEFLQEELSKSDFPSFIEKLIAYRIQSTAKKQLNKVCPLKEVAIRMLILSEDKKRFAVKKEELPAQSKEISEELNEPVTEQQTEEPVEPTEEVAEVAEEGNSSVQEESTGEATQEA